MDNVFKNGYCEPLLGFFNVGWFVDGVIKLEKKIAFYLKKTKKDTLMKKMNNIVERIIFVDFVRKIVNLRKVEINVNYQLNIEVRSSSSKL